MSQGGGEGGRVLGRRSLEVNLIPLMGHDRMFLSIPAEKNTIV